MIVGDITKNSLKLEFIPMDNKEFIIQEIDVTDILDFDELVTKINNIEFNENKYYKISLIGKRKFEIDMYKLNKLILNNNIIKVKNYTKLNYDLEKISKESTLKGLFVKELLEKLNNNPDDIQILENALEIGLEILEK